ncbi:MAG: amidohydrolase [Actinophytocola sp.]|nr:amidohydrolase [Actinophytocola sp.]
MRNDVTEADRLRVRLLQTNPVLGDVDGNLARLDAAVAQSADRDLVVAPELASHGYHVGELADLAGLDPADSLLARLGGHGPAVVTGFVESSGHLLHNSAALVTAGGVRVQRKLFPVTYHVWEEGKFFSPGDRLWCHEVAGARLAVLVCNDAWQPPLPWLAAQSGAEVLVVVANSIESDTGVSNHRAWEVLLLHAAMATQSFVVFVNRAGDECGRSFWGGSRVVHPSGEVLGRLGPETDQLDCSLDLAELRALRTRFPLLRESRTDLVARESERLAALERAG